LVKGDTLAAVAVDIGLGERLRMGPGEVRSGGFRRGSILADALEALLGAIYVEGGFEAAQAAILRVMQPRLRELPPVDDLKDPKTRLQELLQSHGGALPVYKVESIEGRSHSQTFVIRCEVKAFSVVARGRGESRRKAEQDAAAQALTEILHRTKLQVDE
jgi:ribonuclease-3